MSRLKEEIMGAEIADRSYRLIVNTSNAFPSGL